MSQRKSALKILESLPSVHLGLRNLRADPVCYFLRAPVPAGTPVTKDSRVLENLGYAIYSRSLGVALGNGARLQPVVLNNSIAEKYSI